MRGSRIGAIWSLLMAMVGLSLFVTGCDVAPELPTVTSAPVTTLTPIELMIMYTTNTQGIGESTVVEG